MSAAKEHHQPPYRAEHLGSLLRPKELLEKRQAVHEGKLKPEALKPVEQSSIKTAVEKQVELGYRGLTDGEYGYVTDPVLSRVLCLVLMSTQAPHVLGIVLADA